MVLKPLILVVSVSFLIPIIPYHFMNAGNMRLIVVFLTAITTSSISTYCIGLNKNERSLINLFLVKIIPFKSIKK